MREAPMEITKNVTDTKGRWDMTRESFSLFPHGVCQIASNFEIRKIEITVNINHDESDDEIFGDR